MTVTMCVKTWQQNLPFHTCTPLSSPLCHCQRGHNLFPRLPHLYLQARVFIGGCEEEREGSRL